MMLLTLTCYTEKTSRDSLPQNQKYIFFFLSGIRASRLLRCEIQSLQISAVDF